MRNIVQPHITRLWRHVQQDSLFRNSLYLMLATAVVAGLGFFFWLINARLFSSYDIGLATTLISIMNLVAIFSLAGFDTAFVRFLPKASRKNDQINTGMAIVGAIALLLSGAFVLLVGTLSPKLAFITANPLLICSFIFFCVVTALNTLSDSIFLAYRQAKYSLIINALFNVPKVALPFAFVPFGAAGVFLAAAVAQLIGFVISLGILIWKFNYRPRFIIDYKELRLVWRYCTSNYVAVALNLIPVTLLPIVITNNLGPESAAYYYVAMMIGNLLYVIPWATTKSLLAEGSHDEEALMTHVRKSLKVMSMLLLPAIAILLLAGPFVLRLFGASYTQGLAFLELIAISGLAVAAYSVFGSLFRVTKDLKALVVMNICYAATIIGLAYAFLPLGLTGIGLAWLAGNIVASVVGFAYHRFSRRVAVVSA
ncbi:MAG TPA: oligosaccharide flippase family protein [Candidatus Saccharimonadales bacterium]|nr:oligosaccharide flippase family protein [Candidatus Saccharimonadales bacterium]